MSIKNWNIKQNQQGSVSLPRSQSPNQGPVSLPRSQSSPNSVPSNNTSSNSSTQPVVPQNVPTTSNTKNLQKQINTPPQLNVGGTINFSPITFNNGNQSTTIPLSPAQQKQINNNIQYQIMQGVNNILNGGYPNGKTANTGVGGNIPGPTIP